MKLEYSKDRLSWNHRLFWLKIQLTSMQLQLIIQDTLLMIETTKQIVLILEPCLLARKEPWRHLLLITLLKRWLLKHSLEKDAWAHHKNLLMFKPLMKLEVNKVKESCLCSQNQLQFNHSSSFKSDSFAGQKSVTEIEYSLNHLL